jgi:hypothetical protein
MIEVDRSKVKAEWRNAEYKKGLEDFLTKVAMLKPLAKFEVSDKGIETKRHREKETDEITTTHQIFRIRVYENGERLGAISIQGRWRNGQNEECYAVEGFRVSKTRGSRNLTTTSDLKKALSVAKKVFTPRVDDELTELIKSNVTNGVRSLHNGITNILRWDFNVEGEIAMYAMQAYYARKHGEDKCYMPAKPISIRDLAEHDKKCDDFENINELKNMVDAKLGYGVKANADNSLVVYSYDNDTVRRYASFDDLPENIKEKYAVFKVLKQGEPVAHIGCMFADGFAFVSK